MEQSLAKVFVYGTLMFERMQYAVCKRTFESVEACICGFARQNVFYEGKKMIFPALIVRENSTVNGKILLDVDDDSLQRIDLYENTLYKRIIVTAQTQTENIECFAYLFMPFAACILCGEWLPPETIK